MPPIDVEAASRAVTREQLKLFYGFEPRKAYLVRTPRRDYNGRTQGFQFVMGTTIAPARVERDEQWQWDRGEKLSQLRHMGYAVYEMGLEPQPAHEPMWAGQASPNDELGANDFGMDFGIQRTPNVAIAAPQDGEPPREPRA